MDLSTKPQWEKYSVACMILTKKKNPWTTTVLMQLRQRPPPRVDIEAKTGVLGFVYKVDALRRKN